MKANYSDCETVNEIKSRVSQAELLKHYFGIISLPVTINSPLREDKHPSFLIYSPDGIKVYYRDYATGDKGDIYSLIQKTKGISFSKMMRMIAANKELGTSGSTVFAQSSPSFKRFRERTSRDLKVKIRKWESYDIEYWESYGISLKWLKFAEVYPISHKIIYKDGERYVFHAAKYAYVFVEKKENHVSLKVYQPKVTDKRRKWDNSNDSSVVGLWTKVPAKGDKLVICSSLKDALCLWANTGIPAIYVQSETILMSNTAQEVLKSRFKNIYICFDNDAPGLKDAVEFSNQTGFKNVILPSFSEGKDISDLFKAIGKEKFIDIVKPLFGA